MKMTKQVADRIKYLEMERDAAIKTLNDFTNGQTESRVWVEEHPCTGEESGPTLKVRYLQEHSVTFKLGKRTEVYVNLKWDDPCVLRVSCGGSQMQIKPCAANTIEIIGE